MKFPSFNFDKAKLFGFGLNILAHYKQKNFFRSSEFLLGAAGILGIVLKGQNLVTDGDWEKLIYPFLSYAVGRFVSKGLSAPIQANVVAKTDPGNGSNA